MMQKIECRVCKNTKNRQLGWIVPKGQKLKTFSKRKKAWKITFVDRKYLVNENGKLWSGRVCPDCNRENGTKRSRADGHLKRDENHPHFATRESFIAEKRAKVFFENIGFKVEQTKSHGPDLVCTIGNLSWTVEVKGAAPEKMRIPGKKYSGWQVYGICEKRVNDDLIAVVFPEGVYINSMKDHIKKCRSTGNVKHFAFGGRAVNDYREVLLERIKHQSVSLT